MKPIIGICMNHTEDDKVGKSTGLGLGGQGWQLLAGDYIHAIEKAGGCPVLIPVVEDVQNLNPLLNKLDGIVFTGGSDLNPAYYNENPGFELGEINTVRDSHEMNLAKEIMENSQIPVLAICRGIQMLNVYLGGTLYQDIRQVSKYNHRLSNFPKYWPAHEVNIAEGSRMKDIFKEGIPGVNSYHHQAIKDLGRGLKASMVTEDGMIEGAELEGSRCVIGLQWHPEMMVEHNPEYRKLFEYFVNQCK